MMNFANLLSQIESVTDKKSYGNEDTGFWRPTKDKTGNSQAVIRFLPNKNIEDVPFVRRYSHSFKDPTTKRWYIEKSLTTLGQQDYIAEVNGELWNTGLDENKELARSRKRTLKFISNILVIKDPGNPANEGQVMKFEYGKKIFDKIVAAAKPEADLGEEPVNAFDPKTGADFLYKQTVVAGFPNYDQSKFSSSKPLAGGNDAKIQEILDRCHDINEEIAPDKFKSYEELKKKFLWVTGAEQKAAARKEYDTELDELAKIANEKPVAAKPAKAPPVATAVASDDDDDAFFRSLVEE